MHSTAYRSRAQHSTAQHRSTLCFTRLHSLRSHTLYIEHSEASSVDLDNLLLSSLAQCRALATLAQHPLPSCALASLSTHSLPFFACVEHSLYIERSFALRTRLTSGRTQHSEAKRRALPIESTAQRSYTLYTASKLPKHSLDVKLRLRSSDKVEHSLAPQTAPPICTTRKQFTTPHQGVLTPSPEGLGTRRGQDHYANQRRGAKTARPRFSV